MAAPAVNEELLEVPTQNSDLPSAGVHQTWHPANSLDLAQPGLLTSPHRGDSQNNTQTDAMAGLAITHGEGPKTPEPKHQGFSTDTRRGNLQNTVQATIHGDGPKTPEPKHQSFSIDTRRSNLQNTAQATILGDGPKTPEPKRQSFPLITRRSNFQNTSTATTRGGRPNTSEHIYPGFSANSHRGGGPQHMSQMSTTYGTRMPNHMHPSIHGYGGGLPYHFQAPAVAGMGMPSQQHPEFFNNPRRGGSLQNTVQTTVMTGMGMPNHMYPSIFIGNGGSLQPNFQAPAPYGMGMPNHMRPSIHSYGGGLPYNFQAPTMYGLGMPNHMHPGIFTSHGGSSSYNFQAPAMTGMGIPNHMYPSVFTSHGGSLQSRFQAPAPYGMGMPNHMHPSTFHNYGGGSQHNFQAPAMVGMGMPSQLHPEFSNDPRRGGSLQNTVQATAVNRMAMPGNMHPIISTNTRGGSLQDSVQTQAMDRTVATHRDGYKTPKQSIQDFNNIHARAMAEAAHAAAARAEGLVNIHPDKFCVPFAEKDVWFAIPVLPTLVDHVKTDLDPDVTLPSETHEPPISTLAAPRGGLLGVQKVQGFGSHRYGQENRSADTDTTFSEPDWLGWPDPPPGPPVLIHPPGTSQRVIELCESGMYDILLRDVLIILTMPGETDWWGATGPSLRFIRINENGGISDHPLITDIAPFRRWEWGLSHNINPRNRYGKFKSEHVMIWDHHRKDYSIRFLKLDREAAVKADADERRERATSLLSTPRGGQFNGHNDPSRINPGQSNPDQSIPGQSNPSQTNPRQNNPRQTNPSRIIPPLQLSPTPRPSGLERLRAPYVGMEERVLARRGNEGSPPRRFGSWPPTFEDGKSFNEMIGCDDSTSNDGPPREPFMPYIPLRLL